MAHTRIPSRSRRGSFFSVLVYMFEHAFFRMLFFAIAILVTILLIHKLSTIDFDTRDAERNTLSYDLFYSSAGFSYTDPDTGRTYPGVIDLSRFNGNVLDNAAAISSNNHIGARYTLLPPNRENNPIQTAMYNGKFFTTQYAFAKNNVQSNDKTVLWTRSYPVRYIPDPARPDVRLNGVLVEEMVVSQI